MKSITVNAIAAHDKREIKKFVELQREIYRGNSHFVEPIYSEVVKFIHRGPFNEIGEKQLLMAYRGEKPVARLSVHRSFRYNEHYKVNQGFFGFFEAYDDQEAVDAIFAKGLEWLKAKGCETVIGPMNFAIYDEIGILLNAYDQDPVVLNVYNHEYYPRLLETAGFKKEVDWFAFKQGTTAPNFMRLVSQRVLKQKDVQIRDVKPANFVKEANAIRHIFDEAWSENWGNVPFTDKQWNFIISELRRVIWPRYSYICEVDGVPVGFSITIPDANQAVKKAKGRLFPFGWLKILWHLKKIKTGRTIIMGILKEHRNKGYDIAMSYRLVEAARETGKDWSELSLIVETNEPMLAVLGHVGAERYKTYRIYKKTV